MSDPAKTAPNANALLERFFAQQGGKNRVWTKSKMDFSKAKTATVEYEGQSFQIKHWDEYVGNTMAETRKFWEVEWLEKAVKLYPVQKTVVDIGAHIGSTSLFFKHFLKPEKLVAIEPAQDNYMLLFQNLTDAICLKMALSNKSGDGFIRNPLEGLSAGIYKLDSDGEPVSLRTLDSLNLDDVTLIKIDVEEHEKEVLEGGLETLKRCRPVIMLELHKSVNTPEFHRWMQNDLGYKFKEECPFASDVNVILEPF